MLLASCWKVCSVYIFNATKWYKEQPTPVFEFGFGFVFGFTGKHKPSKFFNFPPCQLAASSRKLPSVRSIAVQAQNLVHYQRLTAISVAIAIADAGFAVCRVPCALNQYSITIAVPFVQPLIQHQYSCSYALICTLSWQGHHTHTLTHKYTFYSKQHRHVGN